MCESVGVDLLPERQGLLRRRRILWGRDCRADLLRPWHVLCGRVWQLLLLSERPGLFLRRPGNPGRSVLRTQCGLLQQHWRRTGVLPEWSGLHQRQHVLPERPGMHRDEFVWDADDLLPCRIDLLQHGADSSVLSKRHDLPIVWLLLVTGDAVGESPS